MRPEDNRAVSWTALGCGLAGGAFFAFSAFVMPALDDLPAADGIAAMQSINRKAVTAPFMLAVFLPAAGCAYVAFAAARDRSHAHRRTLLIGSTLYLVGTIGVTIAANVPLNDTLAATPAGAANAADEWQHYVTAWTWWNHIRTVTSLAAAATFLSTLRPLRPSVHAGIRSRLRSTSPRSEPATKRV